MGGGRELRIGLIGYYGHGNAGDERILQCLRRALSHHDVYATDRYEDPELDRCDLVLLGGGGLILRNTNFLAPFIERHRRFACIGVSVETLHEDNAGYIQAILNRAEFVHVRDERSSVLLGNHPKVVIGSDLSFLYPLDPAPWHPDGPMAVNLRPWPYWRAEFNSPEYHRIARVAHYFRPLKWLYPGPKWDERKAMRLIAHSGRCLVPYPLYQEPGQLSSQAVLGKYFGKVPDQCDPEALRGCGSLVAMRLHALLFATQMGIPFTSLSYQPKNVVFCHSVGMGWASVDIFDLRSLPETIERMLIRAPYTREQLLDYTSDARDQVRAQVRDLLGVPSAAFLS